MATDSEIVGWAHTVFGKNPFVAGPLRRTDCSLVSDGAAALVITAAMPLADDTGDMG